MEKVNRRTALKTLGLATAATAAVSLPSGAASLEIISAASKLPTTEATSQNEIVVNTPIPTASKLYPFEGVYQNGIITDPPEAVLLVSLDLFVESQTDLVKLFKTLTRRIRSLMAGQLGDSGEDTPDYPAENTGELGFDPLKEGNLAITVGVGASMFEQDEKDRFGLSSLKPTALKLMPRYLPGDKLNPAFLDGDLFLQISSDHALFNMHALRDILKNTKGQLVPRWVQPGFQRFFKAEAGQAKARGLLGFKDGTANLDTSDNALMSKLVWTGVEEPAWAQGGTYVAVRKIREQIERWDRLTLNQQQESIGRHKVSGAALDNDTQKETALPNYGADPAGDKVPLDGHIRKANPRLGEERDKRRMLRRGYIYFNGVDKSGLLDAGFLFMGFCRNIEEQFEYVKLRYMTNRNFPTPGTGSQDLDEYLFAIGGGYFYLLPGVQASDRFLADALLLG